ncbi:MAG TPA: hypothetical protein VFW38_08900 [Solirubrobacteraceae bacterium]|nr:hypothetical protein [Solirubrobacteraceae bacterium]
MDEDDDLDTTDLSAEEFTVLFDGIPGAYESAMRGLEQARAGETVALDDL